VELNFPPPPEYAPYLIWFLKAGNIQKEWGSNFTVKKYDFFIWSLEISY
jgi:hypothetical protein